MYAIPAQVVNLMNHTVATRLFWKLVYVDLVNALRAQHPPSASHKLQLLPTARVLFVHPQNGLGNRLRAVASGLAMARATRRVPVVVWEKDPHLGAAFEQLFVSSVSGTDMSTLLYKDLVVMDQFPNWADVSHRDPSWYSINYMSKDGKQLKPDTAISFETPVINPASSLQSATSSIQVDREGRPTKIHPSMHIYFKSAYVANTNPRSFSMSRAVNGELSRLVPTKQVLDIANQIDPAILKRSIGIHIRSRRLKDDQVDVNTNCEYSMEGAHTTDYWRYQSRLPVFEYKMNVMLRRDRNAHFFVAADDVASLTRLKQKFPGRVHAISRNCDDRNPQCVLYAMADLLCLSKTREIYGSNWSSFSEAARRMGNIRIHLSGRHFGIEKRSEKRGRLRWRKFWNGLDRLAIFNLLNGCYWKR